MARIGFYVELEIDPAQRHIFDQKMLQHSKATLDGEPGCLAFDVYADRRDPNKYALYELYADEAALDAHRFSAQLAKHRKEVDQFILSRRIWLIGGEVDVSQFPGKDE